MSASRRLSAPNGVHVELLKWSEEKALGFCKQLLNRPYMWDDVASADPVNSLAAMLTNPSVVWYDIGPDMGIVWFEILPSGVSTVHVLIWDRRAYGHPELVVQAAREIAEKHKVHRFQAFIPATNARAVTYAERCGLTYEGTLRGFGKFGGAIVDAHVYGALVSEYEEEAAYEAARA